MAWVGASNGSVYYNMKKRVSLGILKTDPAPPLQNRPIVFAHDDPL